MSLTVLLPLIQVHSLAVLGGVGPPLELPPPPQDARKRAIETIKAEANFSCDGMIGSPFTRKRVYALNIAQRLIRLWTDGKGHLQSDRRANQEIAPG
jgi:hypothetical protein